MGRLLSMYGIEASINTATSDSAEVWSPLDEGLDNIAEALNETVQQYFFLRDKGFARNHVTGMAPAITLTGRRVLGDPAQDFIFAAKYKLDSARETSFKLERMIGGKIVTLACPVTLCNLQELSGATNDDSAISIELRINGAPVQTESAAPES